MAEQTIAPVSAAHAASTSAPAPAAAKAPEAVKTEPPKTEAIGTVGTTAPSTGTGTKVNYYA